MFDNSMYTFTHGKAPKGTGLWAFSTHKNPEVEDIKFFYGSLTEAKRKARKAFGATATIYILG